MVKTLHKFWPETCLLNLAPEQFWEKVPKTWHTPLQGFETPWYNFSLPLTQKVEGRWNSTLTVAY